MLGVIDRRARDFSEALAPIVKQNNILMLGGSGSHCFPMGGCAMSSRLFGHFLLIKDEIVTELVRGVHRDAKTTEHVWLQLGSCIIDLTNCQFDESHTLPACPFESPLVSETEAVVDWYSSYWPESQRSHSNIPETQLTDFDRRLIDEIDTMIDTTQ